VSNPTSPYTLPAPPQPAIVARPYRASDSLRRDLLGMRLVALCAIALVVAVLWGVL
jgi:hypothetical protein